AAAEREAIGDQRPVPRVPAVRGADGLGRGAPALLLQELQDVLLIAAASASQRAPRTSTPSAPTRGGALSRSRATSDRRRELARDRLPPMRGARVILLVLVAGCGSDPTPPQRPDDAAVPDGPRGWPEDP